MKALEARLSAEHAQALKAAQAKAHAEIQAAADAHAQKLREDVARAEADAAQAYATERQTREAQALEAPARTVVLTEPTAAQGLAAMPKAPRAKPPLLTAARNGSPDDLKLIWGVGPKLEQMLFKLGVYHFDQIAAWTPDQVRWIEDNIGEFRDRVERDKWVEQSVKLATGWRPKQAAGDKPSD
jgi:NADH-quinone oxidoreductase subunit E